MKFEEATKADPNHADARFQLGMALLNEGKVPDAVDVVRAVHEDGAHGPVRRAGQGDAGAAQAAARRERARQRHRRTIALAGRCGPGSPQRPRAPGRAARRRQAGGRVEDLSGGRARRGRRGRRAARLRREQGAGGPAEDRANRPTLRIRWHLIGHLQSNKARKAGEAFDWIHAVDSAALLRKIDEGAVAAGRRPKALVQVDLAGEATKFGASPADLPGIFAAAAACGAVDLVGLMLLPPAVGRSRRGPAVVPPAPGGARRARGHRACRRRGWPSCRWA